MPQVQFTPILSRFFPDLAPTKIRANGISELMDSLELKYPGIRDYILDEQGTLRQHVNIFVNQERLLDQELQETQFHPDDEVLIMQALSGG